MNETTTLQPGVVIAPGSGPAIGLGEGGEQLLARPDRRPVSLA